MLLLASVMLSASVVLLRRRLLSREAALLVAATVGGTAARQRRHAAHGLAGQVDVDAPLVMFGGILQAEPAADLFDARFDLLYVPGAVVAPADDAAARLSVRDCIQDPALPPPMRRLPSTIC